MAAVMQSPDERERTRRNVMLALAHVGLVLAILAAFVWSRIA